jgi:dephospho-CoA kinase
MMQTSYSRVVGLTGGVASGKSTVAAFFASSGVRVIDVDDISRTLTAPGGAALPEIKSLFPDAFSAGLLDRAQLRSIVFADASKRRALEAVLHPMIRAETRRQLMDATSSDAPYTLLVIPLLFENDGYRGDIDCSVVVDVPRSTQIERMVRTRGLAVQIAEQIVAAQFSREDRLARTQFVIENSGSTRDAQLQVARLHQVFLATYHANTPPHRNELASEALA